MDSANKKKQLVIVGNGMAAGRLIDEIQKRNLQLYDITVIGDEPQGSYNRIMLSSVLAGDAELDSVIQKDARWYQQHGIRFLGGCPVVSVDSESMQLQLGDGSLHNYDELVMATGSRPAAVSATNQHLDNIFAFRTLEDVQDIDSIAAQSSKAVVIGGGLLGLEAAYGLAKKDIQVTLVHRASWLLNRQLDEASGEQLRQVMSAMNINFHLNDEVASFEGGRKVESAILKSGEKLECTLVVIATGITPNTQLAESAQLNCRHAISVDELMRTSVPHISALGECCEYQDTTFGLVEPIWQQCISLADRLAGNKATPFSIQPIATKLKVSGVQVFSAGIYITQPHHRELVMRDPTNHIYRKLLLDHGRIVGIVLFGDIRDGNWYFDLMLSRVDLSEHISRLIFGRAYCNLEPKLAA